VTPREGLSDTFSGRYPIERRAGEIERLHLQSAAFARDVDAMLDRIAVREGWSCLDLGCGPGGITEPLSRRVGVSGRVVGLDKDAEFLAHARARAAANVQFRQDDAYASDLPPDSFDLVHMRFLASTSGDPERVIREAIRLCRPGRTVALQEPDCATLNCYPPHPAWEKLKSAVVGVFGAIGGDVYLGQCLYRLARQMGLADVHYRPVLIGVRATDPMVDYLPATAESLRGTIIKLGLLSDDEFPKILSEARQHLQKADTVFTLYTVAQVWGRKP
jgi:SAM-dependent methyltransferase